MHMVFAILSFCLPCHSILDAAADKEASEMLTGNAQNLMQAVSEVCVCTWVCGGGRGGDKTGKVQ